LRCGRGDHAEDDTVVHHQPCLLSYEIWSTCSQVLQHLAIGSQREDRVATPKCGGECCHFVSVAAELAYAYGDLTVDPRLGLIFEQEEPLAIVVELHSIVPNSSTCL
jgi:hypothetical protein